MRSAFAPLLLLFSSLPAAADEQAAPNMLTPEEAAAGWALLFDGENGPGLRVRGEVGAANGQVILGGSVGSRLGPKEPLPGAFELRVDYRMVGDIVPMLILERGPSPFKVIASKALPRLAADPETWHRLSVLGALDPQTGIRTLTETVTVPGQTPVTLTLGHFQEDQILAVWIQTQPGEQLLFQNLKLRADRPASTRMPWLIGLSAAAGLVLAGSLYFWRRRKGRTAG